MKLKQQQPITIPESRPEAVLETVLSEYYSNMSSPLPLITSQITPIAASRLPPRLLNVYTELQPELHQLSRQLHMDYLDPYENYNQYYNNYENVKVYACLFCGYDGNYNEVRDHVNILNNINNYLDPSFDE